ALLAKYADEGVIKSFSGFITHHPSRFGIAVAQLPPTASPSPGHRNRRPSETSFGRRRPSGPYASSTPCSLGFTEFRECDEPPSHSRTASNKPGTTSNGPDRSSTAPADTRHGVHTPSRSGGAVRRVQHGSRRRAHRW